MASTVAIYKHGIRLGVGSASAGSASITSYTKDNNAVALKRNINVVVTQAGTHNGRSWQARVLADNGAGTLTLSQACPFVGA